MKPTQKTGLLFDTFSHDEGAAKHHGSSHLIVYHYPAFIGTQQLNRVAINCGCSVGNCNETDEEGLFALHINGNVPNIAEAMRSMLSFVSYSRTE